jgi:hypothetical protein
MPGRANRLAGISRALAIGGGATLVVSPLGYRLEWVPLGPAFVLPLAGFVLSVIALLLSAGILAAGRSTPRIPPSGSASKTTSSCVFGRLTAGVASTSGRFPAPAVATRARTRGGSENI